MTIPSEEDLRLGGSPPRARISRLGRLRRRQPNCFRTSEEITPTRVAMAGAVVLLLLSMAVSGWYWVLPRDAVTVETHYMQRVVTS